MTIIFLSGMCFARDQCFLPSTIGLGTILYHVCDTCENDFSVMSNT